MIVELGHYALILALSVSLVQSVAPLIGARIGDKRLMDIGPVTASAGFLLLAFSFSALTAAYVTSDFSVLNVFENSHSLKPMIFKISGVWGNHEGSMLLWVLILAFFGALVATFGRDLPPSLKANVLAVQAWVLTAVLAFILLTSNPFTRIFPVPFEGQDLNPILQDIGLAIHPPLLYLGYVGFSIAFSFAVAALIDGRIDAAWARWVRPWTLAAWICLTLGIAMGSYWAYYELGWGGWWFWDPVENASFMPWLFAAALLHSAIVVEKREALKSWTVLLAILAFGFSLIGTFIVRSGIITSVHAFANDPERGVFILAILAAFTGGALTLFAARAQAMEAKGVFGMISRESALVMNNIFLAVSSMVIFVGTVWPVVAELAFDRKLSVGPPFFDMAFTPFVIALAVILPVGSMLPWKRGSLAKTMLPLWPVLGLSVALAGLAYAMTTGESAVGPLGVLLGVWVFGGALVDLWRRTGRGTGRLRRLRRLPGADWGKAVAHAGLGITIFAICALVAWQQEDIRVAQPGEPFTVGRYDLILHDVTSARGPNYLSTVGEIHVFRNGEEITRLFPEKRNYPVARMPTTEAAIDYRFLRDLYVVIGDAQAGGGWTVRTYIKPFANWIWGGCIIMALGGLLSLTDRRFRVAAGARKAPAAGVPAE